MNMVFTINLLFFAENLKPKRGSGHVFGSKVFTIKCVSAVAVV